MERLKSITVDRAITVDIFFLNHNGDLMCLKNEIMRYIKNLYFNLSE